MQFNLVYLKLMQLTVYFNFRFYYNLLFTLTFIVESEFWSNSSTEFLSVQTTTRMQKKQR